LRDRAHDAQLANPDEGDVEFLRDFTIARLAVEAMREPFPGVRVPALEQAQVARRPHEEFVVSHVMAEFADDRQPSESLERRFGARIVTIGGFDEADRGDLLEIVAFQPGAQEPARAARAQVPVGQNGRLANLGAATGWWRNDVQFETPGG
jgi:hypothetical protein